jgi:hypothetical protein
LFSYVTLTNNPIWVSRNVLSGLRHCKCTGSHRSARVSLPGFCYSKKIKYVKNMLASWTFSIWWYVSSSWNNSWS